MSTWPMPLPWDYLFKINSDYTDSAVIHMGISDTVLRAMIAIYNATASLPACDSVINIYPAATYALAPYYMAPIKKLSVQADESAGFITQIKNGIFPTGFAPFDNLMTKYHFSITSHSSWSFGVYNMYLESDSNYNMAGVAPEFLTVTDIWNAYPSLMGGGGNYVRVDTITDTYTDLFYSYGWGDCLLGCMYRHNWFFRVGHDCTVTSTGSTGHPLPPPESILDNHSETPAIYPNPVNDVLHINNVGTVDYAIYGLQGQLIQSGKTSKSVYVNMLPVGAYFIRMRNENVTIVQQFLKE